MRGQQSREQACPLHAACYEKSVEDNAFLLPFRPLLPSVHDPLQFFNSLQGLFQLLLQSHNGIAQIYILLQDLRQRLLERLDERLERPDALLEWRLAARARAVEVDWLLLELGLWRRAARVEIGRSSSSGDWLRPDVRLRCSERLLCGRPPC